MQTKALYDVYHFNFLTSTLKTQTRKHKVGCDYFLLIFKRNIR